MRKAKLTQEEILEAEKAKDDRRNNRRNGFSLMEVRDRGWAKMTNGTMIEWHVPKSRREQGVCYSGVEDGDFVLYMGKEKRAFNGEEFRKWMRWV